MSEMGIQPLEPTSNARFKSGPDAKDVHYHAFYEGVPDEYILLTEQTLGETTTNKENGLKKLKEFMKKENLSATDDLLIMVLRACKYNVKKSETKLKRYLKYQKSLAEKICRMDEKKIECIVEDTIFSVLPYRDKFGRAILITKPISSLDKYSFEDIEHVFMCFISYLLTFPMTSICGLSYIAEAHFESTFIMYSVVKRFKIYVDFMLASPLRVGRVDILHEPFLIHLLVNSLRPILPRKLTQRIFFNGSTYTDLHSAYPPDILPKEFDGKMEPINCKHYKENLMKFIQKMKEESQKKGILRNAN